MHKFHNSQKIEQRISPKLDAFYLTIGLTNIIPVVKGDQFKGMDKTMFKSDGTQISVEEKVREKDWGDILLEITSNDQTNTKGWTEKCEATCVVYAIVPSDTIYLLPTKALKDAWVKNKEDWESKYYTRKAKNEAKNSGTYNTVNVPVPTNVLYSAMFDELTDSDKSKYKTAIDYQNACTYKHSLK